MPAGRSTRSGPEQPLHHPAEATVEREGITEPVHLELEAARAELDRLVSAAHAERDRANAEVDAARSELDRLVRARVDVHRELSALGEALRKWMGAASKAGGKA